MIATLPVLTRLYSPESFGMYSIFSSFYGILVVCMTFKFDSALILPKENNEANKLNNLIFYSSLFTLLVTLAILPYLVYKYGYFITVLPFAMLFGTYLTVGQQWAARIQDYTSFSYSSIIATIINISLSFTLFYLFGDNGIHFIVAIFASYLVSAAYLDYKVKKNSGSRFFKTDLTFKKVKDTFNNYRSFLYYVFPAALTLMIGVNGLPIVLKNYYSYDDIGIFSLSYRLALMPVGVIVSVLNEAFRREFVERINQKIDYVNLFRRVLLLLFTISIVSIVIIFLTVDYLVDLLLDEEFRLVSEYVKFMSPLIISMILYQPLSYVLIALRKERNNLVIQIFIYILPLIIFTISLNYLQIDLSILTYSIISLLIVILSVAYINRVVENSKV